MFHGRFHRSAVRVNRTGRIMMMWDLFKLFPFSVCGHTSLTHYSSPYRNLHHPPHLKQASKHSIHTHTLAHTHLATRPYIKSNRRFWWLPSKSNRSSSPLFFPRQNRQTNNRQDNNYGTVVRHSEPVIEMSPGVLSPEGTSHPKHWMSQ